MMAAKSKLLAIAQALAPPPVICELVIVPTREVAVRAGFNVNRREHGQHPGIHVWWLELSTRHLITIAYPRVTVDGEVGRYLHHYCGRAERERWDEAQQILKGKQMIFGNQAVWMEF
jgi:hypothetical protein